MQTLNVGAGRTDSEYAATEESRLAELRDEVRTDADYFFWAAGLATASTGLLPIRIGVLLNIGFFDLLTLYGKSLGKLFMYGSAATWVAALVALGFAARRNYRWAFMIGIIVHSADMLALIATFSIFAFGVHGFFVFKWFQGQKALKDLNDAKNALP